MLKTDYPSSQGFTLVEVLVAMVIMAIGLLGLAGLQTLSMKDNQDAYLYSQATALAYEMGDRIRANAVEWRKSAVPAAATSCPSTNCSSAAGKCTPTQMAAFDYCYWKSSVTNKLASGATAVVDVSGTSGVCSGGSDYRCLTITWSGSNQSNSSFQLEVKP